jgi:serine palmitoyltransferase
VPALLAVSASEGINLLRSMPSLLVTLQDNIGAARAVLERAEHLDMPSHRASPIIHLHIRAPAHTHLDPHTHTQAKSNPLSAVPRDAPPFDAARDDRLLQGIVDECLAQGVWIVRARRLRG